jgi:signal transduction histidine kinase
VFGLKQRNDVNLINLQGTTIDNSTEIELDTGWEFYWKELIVPGNFKKSKPLAIVSLNNWTSFALSNKEKLPSFGYATYRLKISIPEERSHVSLQIPKAFSSSKLWINGKFISEIGCVGKSKETTQHRRISQIIPLNTNETDFEIVIQVANYYHMKAGLTQPLILGASYTLHTLKSKIIIADIIFIGCIGFMGIFFLFFFLFYWNKDRAVLYFSILCISLSYMALSDRYAPFTELFQSVSWIFLTRIEYISLFTAGFSASLFFSIIFLNFIHKNYIKIVVFVFGLLVLLAICLFAPHFTKLVLPFIGILLLNFVYITFVIIKAIISKRYESILLLVSMLMGSSIFYIHVFFFLGEDGFAIIYVNFGYVLLFLLLSMLLMKRFSNSFKELEKSNELTLKQKEEIYLKSNQLSIANLELEKNLKLLGKYNSELDDFNHIVSHDLKSPLVAVHALASFIEEDIKTTISKEAKNNLRLLKDVISKMDALINGLLKYSKIARGDKRKEHFSLNDLLKKVAEIVDSQNKSIIHMPKEDVKIFANKIELTHVFQNLISNAIKHNDKELTVINISVAELSKEYLFSVSDNGPGIAPKYHDIIFKMFSQLHVNDDIESTGIGLAIVKKLIHVNKGIITLTSEKNIGIKIQFSWRI